MVMMMGKADGEPRERWETVQFPTFVGKKQRIHVIGPMITGPWSRPITKTGED